MVDGRIRIRIVVEDTLYRMSFDYRSLVKFCAALDTVNMSCDHTGDAACRAAVLLSLRIAGQNVSVTPAQVTVWGVWGVTRHPYRVVVATPLWLRQYLTEINDGATWSGFSSHANEITKQVIDHMRKGVGSHAATDH